MTHGRLLPQQARSSYHGPESMDRSNRRPAITHAEPAAELSGKYPWVDSVNEEGRKP